uniref:Zinc finger CCHC domain-containing protein 7 n=2 Tax=Myripristis murdjan TaxID=586833 RepID=A0A667Y7R0_9TELE
MYCGYQDREEFEDELYQEEDDEEEEEGSEVNSELEFQLYSQLHYSSNAGEREEEEDGGEKEQEGKRQDGQRLQVVETSGERKDSEPNRLPSPGVGRPAEHLKGHAEAERKKEKLHDQRKRKGAPKGQRPSASLFQEVIVIDSGTEVISISDDTDDGVCAFKGQKSRPLQASTPAQQATRQRKRSPSLVEDSVSSGSESEESESESESESDSDSDGLESWMILGRDNQDGDQSISLNLEGESDSSSDADEDEERKWLVSNKDKEAQIYNKDKGVRMPVNRMSNRYYTDKNVTCRNCSKTGHLSKNCPNPKKVACCFLCGTPGHQVAECPNRHCANCGLPGHLYESCSERAYWHKQCHRCGMTGHFFDACPEIWRQYHITIKSGPPQRQEGEDMGRTPPYCYNCSRKGHFGYACTQRRMFNGTYPTTPFINCYDTVEEIRRREHRIKLKVKELRENGLFPPGSQMPLTPGPPRKRQKNNHHNNSNQPDHRSYQTPNNHKPSPKHIMFRDNKQASAMRPKTKKADKHKQQGTSSTAKPWQPKRAVPTSRGPLPPVKPVKLVFNEADDFPRGGVTGEKKEKKNKRKKKNRQGLLGPPEAHFRPAARTPDRLFGVGPGGEMKRKRRRARGRERKAANMAAADMYPTDENLFIIKQRKRKR